MRFILPTFMLLLFAGLAVAVTIHVPGDYPTIQEGINASENGDTVLVADGTYDSPDDKNLDFQGREIVLISENGPNNTIIDCQFYGRGFYFHSGETSAAKVIGFAIRSGFSIDGGGIHIDNSSPTFEHCVINDCVALNEGGGIYVLQGTSSFINCVIHNNSATSGGGFSGENTDVTVNSCSFAANSSSG